MRSHADGTVHIQTSSESMPSAPLWFGEVVLLTAHLRKHGVFNKINEQVRFARRRFGRYEVIDFLAVLFTASLAKHQEVIEQRQIIGLGKPIELDELLETLHMLLA